MKEFIEKRETEVEQNQFRLHELAEISQQFIKKTFGRSLNVLRLSKRLNSCKDFHSYGFSLLQSNRVYLSISHSDDFQVYYGEH